MGTLTIVLSILGFLVSAGGLNVIINRVNLARIVKEADEDGSRSDKEKVAIKAARKIYTKSLWSMVGMLFKVKFNKKTTPDDLIKIVGNKIK